MVYVNKKGYLERKTKSRLKNSKSGKAPVRDWWLVKAGTGKIDARIQLRNVSFPPKYLGKKVMIKVVEIKEKELLHYVIWKKDRVSGRYPVYLCNQAVIPKKGKTIINSKGMIHHVTCKNCLKILEEKWERKKK